MANLLMLKRRIKTAANVSKTTRAMQMVAVSKLKKAQEATTAGRPYAEKLMSVSQNVLGKANGEFEHAYMKNNGKDKVLAVVIGPDKGLCGGLITNMTREISNFDAQNKNVAYITVGKKMESAVISLQKELVAAFKFGATLPSFEMVLPIIDIIDEYFLGQKVGKVKIISTNFTSVFAQKPSVTDLLPIVPPEAKSSTLMLFEPNASKLLPPLLKHFIEMTIYQKLLESYASEQGAKMVAMQSATDNAMDIVSDLGLEYNKGRQEKITNEILDIGSATFSLSI